MITKAYEIQCDWCTAVEPEKGNKSDCIRNWIYEGWIVYVDDKAFCGKDCQVAYDKDKKRS